MSKPCFSLRLLGRRFFSDESGVVSIVGAMLMLLGLGLSVLVVDVGHLYLERRRLQSAVDAAALAAVGDLTRASSIGGVSLSRNGYSQDATVTVGIYTADPSVVADQRFTASATSPNAVRVTKTISTSDFFAGMFGITTLSQVNATATAARIPAVSFSAGTGLASLNGGTVNTVLNALFGSNLSLSLVNYQGLASANVDALTFLDQLAIRANVQSGTYGDLANANVTMGQMIQAAQAAINIHPSGNDTAALEALNLLAVQIPQGVSATLSQIVNTTLWEKRDIGSIVQQVPGQTTINLFDTLSAMARVYGGGHMVTLNSAVTLPPIGTSVITRMTIGSPMASLAVARVGDSVSTSQVRLALTVTSSIASLGTISLPIYLDVASGTATVAAISCTNGGKTATLSTASQATTIQLGTVTDADLGSFQNPVRSAPAPLISLSVVGIPVSISGSASAAVAAGPEAEENFTQTDIDAGAVKTAAGSDAGHVLSGLTNNLTLSTNIAGAGVLSDLVNSTLNATVLPLVRSEIATLLTALDPAVGLLLQTLGLRLGEIDTIVHGVSCGVPTLIK